MNLDFTLTKYEELCSAIVQSGYAAMSVKDYLSLQPREKVVILRHDVDRKPEKALKMADIYNDGEYQGLNNTTRNLEFSTGLAAVNHKNQKNLSICK